MDIRNQDEAYVKLVSARGLYGKAFFGHKATKQERRTLDRLWALAQKTSSVAQA